MRRRSRVAYDGAAPLLNPPPPCSARNGRPSIDGLLGEERQGDDPCVNSTSKRLWTPPLSPASRLVKGDGALANNDFLTFQGLLRAGERGAA